MKKTEVISVKIIDPMGAKVTASERIDSNSHNPIVDAFHAYRERHKANFSQGCEFMLVGEGVW